MSMTTTKSKKTESVVIYDEDSIARLTADKSIQSTFIKSSKCTDDDVLMALIIKYKLLEYECSVSKCTVKTTWIRAPIKLIINRINGQVYDLRPDNLQLLCPNCYSQQYSRSNIIKQIVQKKILTCKICGYDKVHMLEEIYRRVGYCKTCYRRIQENSASERSVIDTSLLLIKSIQEASENDIMPRSVDEYTSSIKELMPSNTISSIDDGALLTGSLDKRESKTSKIRRAINRLNIKSDAGTVEIACLEDINIADFSDQLHYNT